MIQSNKGTAAKHSLRGQPVGWHYQDVILGLHATRHHRGKRYEVPIHHAESLDHAPHLFQLRGALFLLPPVVL